MALKIEVLRVIKDAIGEWPTRFPTVGNGSSVVQFHYRVIYDGSIEGTLCDKAYIDGVEIGTPHECGPATKENAGTYETNGSIAISPSILPWTFKPLGHTFNYEMTINGFITSRETRFWFKEEIKPKIAIIIGSLTAISIIGYIAYKLIK